MKDLTLALMAGIIVGILFKAVKLPLPAPPVWAGILGIAGIMLGGQAYDWIVEHYFKK